MKSESETQKKHVYPRRVTIIDQTKNGTVQWSGWLTIDDPGNSVVLDGHTRRTTLRELAGLMEEYVGSALIFYDEHALHYDAHPVGLPGRGTLPELVEHEINLKNPSL